MKEMSTSPGRKLSTEKMGKMADMKAGRKSPAVKKIDNRYPQVRKSGRKAA